jgi:phosphohistidine phosphatase
MGRYLASEGLVPDLVLVSDAKRTQQTWDLVKAAFPSPPAMRLEPRIYEAAPARLLSVVEDVPSACKTLMLIGHNPGMVGLALALSGHGDRYALSRMRRKFPTAGVAVLDFATEDWADITAGSGRLDRFVTPKSLEPSFEDD